jgi:VanZ family protein
MLKSTAIKPIVNAWMPVVLLMSTIYFLSAQPKFAPPEPTNDIYFSGIIPIFPGSWDFIIKKIEHMLIYGALALLNLRALVTMKIPLQSAYYGALALTMSFALTDEFHQRFIAGRSASLRDVGIDFLGAVIAIMAVRRLAHLWRDQRPVPVRQR